MVSYGGKTIPRWRTAAILKIDISPYLSEKSSDFHEILNTAADFKLDERHVALVPNEKVALDRLRVRQNVFLVLYIYIYSVLLNCTGWSLVTSRMLPKCSGFIILSASVFSPSFVKNV